MPKAAMAMASSIQFWNGTRPSTRNSSTSQSSKESPQGYSLLATAYEMAIL